MRLAPASDFVGEPFAALGELGAARRRVDAAGGAEPPAAAAANEHAHAIAGEKPAAFVAPSQTRLP